MLPSWMETKAAYKLGGRDSFHILSPASIPKELWWHEYLCVALFFDGSRRAELDPS